jgi:hypothetical protein
MDNIKITQDGFVWLIVTDSAKELWSSGALQIFELLEDGESLIMTRNSYQYQNQ